MPADAAPYDVTAYADAARAQRLLPPLLTHSLVRNFAPMFERALAACPDPDGALLILTQLLVDTNLSPDAERAFATLRAHATGIELLTTVAAASPLLGRSLLVDTPRRLGVLAAVAAGESPAVQPFTDTVTTVEEFHAELRRYARERFLDIVARDVGCDASLETTTAAISRLAADALDAAHTWHAHHLAASQDGPPTTIAVMGMGKLGGGELNYSSDIDLIYFFAPDVNGTHAVRLAEGVTRALSEVTAEGLVFRVDLRLRPDGGQGPIAMPAPAAVEYYLTWGRPWEQAALIKARPVAGDIATGEAFVADVEPFVYRRYLDYLYVDDMKTQKAAINREASRREAFARDVKLGHGGIREIEFFVSTFQLIHGGRRPALRARGTMEALHALVNERLVTDEHAQNLADAYRYLRRVEHMIQIAEFRQTQVVPTEPTALARIAALMGETGPRTQRTERFLAALDHHRDIVADAFEQLFYEPSRVVETAADDDLAGVAQGEVSEEHAVAILARHGFADPQAGVRALARLREGAPTVARSRVSSALVSKLLPLVVAEIAASPNPDRALIATEAFLARTGARAPTLALLAENPPTARFLFRLFGASEYLSAFFITHPELLDTLVRTGGGGFDEGAIARELDTILHPPGHPEADYERFLDELRRFMFEKTLALGLTDLEGERDIRAVQSGLTALADTIVREALGEAMATVGSRHGAPVTDTGDPAHLAVVAMGSYGSGELLYASDLDLIFVYSASGETRAPQRALTNAEFFARVAQRTISTLTVPTTHGRCYDVDMRLRPSGNAGPLVTSVRAFHEYHDQSAAAWERMALTRARVVAGEPSLRDALAEDLAHIPYQHPLSGEAVREIPRLRRRMVEELADNTPGHYDLKLGNGGLTDIEFIAQYQSLVHHLPRPTPPHTLAVLQRMREYIDERDMETLTHAYLLYERIISRLRMVLNIPTHAVALGIASDEAHALTDRAIAELLDYAAPSLSASDNPRNALRALMEETRTHVRACYTKYVGD